MTDSEKLDLLLEKMSSFDNRMGSLETQMEALETRMESFETRMESFETNADTLKMEVTKINLTLENETNRNIKIIAEGHLDLSRKLNECVRLASDIKAKQEIQDIYINMHNNQLKAI